MALQQTLEIQFEETGNIASSQNTQNLIKKEDLSFETCICPKKNVTLRMQSSADLITTQKRNIIILNNMKNSETITENLFRDFYGTETFIEKSSIDDKYGFTSKKGTKAKGYPDFFLEKEDYVIIVEAKADNFKKACSEVKFYATHNKIDNKDIIAIAVSGQDKNELQCAIYVKLRDKKMQTILADGSLQSIDQIECQYRKIKMGDLISVEALHNTLVSLNKKFHDLMKIKDTERSLFFSGLMIALKDSTFIQTYKFIQAPSDNAPEGHFFEAHNLNMAILEAIERQIASKINNHSKEYNWKDRFAFIKTIDYPLNLYKEIISLIEEKIFIPFKYDEKLDILGKAYKTFLSRAGKIENKNIILTPDHIKELMVALARLDVDDVLIDTCTGSGGFLMEGMEVLVKKAGNDTQKINQIKEKQLIGIENDSTLFALACSNMFLHGDGRTNLIYNSSLVDSKSQLFKYIRELKPTKCVINPPYENNLPIQFTKIALDMLEKNGRLIIIMPTPTLTRNIGGLTDKILKMAKLDFVIKMPYNIFSEQHRTVNTSIFGFTKTAHCVDDEVAFYNLEDDGLVSIQHKGRVDKYNKWEQIRTDVLNCVNGRSYWGKCEKRRIFSNDGELRCSGYPCSKTNDKMVKFGDIFNLSTKGTLQSEQAEDGIYDFVTASEEIKKHSTYVHDKEAIVYAVAAGGSLGRSHYVNGKFIASNLCLVLTPKNPEKYPINIKFYTLYLNSIRKKIVAEVSDGVSKLTLNPKDLANFYLEYFDLEEQNRIAQEYSDSVEEKKKELSLAIESFDDKYSSIFDSSCFS